jgi:hypothetical protein
MKVVFAAFQQRQEAVYTANMVREFQGYPPLRSPWKKVWDWMLCRSGDRKKAEDDEEMVRICCRELLVSL